MSQSQTETLHPAADGLDVRGDEEILAVLLEGHLRAIASIEPALSSIGAGARLMAQTIAGGGRLVFAAAGSSGLMAQADALELGGTFGIPTSQIIILMSGGLPVDSRMPGDSEDDIAEAQSAAELIAPGDTVIVVSASGTTPYAMAIAKIARAHGAKVIAISNNPGAALFAYADVTICAPTPPEVIAGSTRMGAGTAQKAVLNMMSALMGIRLGHVHDGMMVNVIADNEKLRGRAAAIVARIGEVDAETALDCLKRANGAVKPAVLLAVGLTPVKAQELLEKTNGNLRASLARV